MKIQSSSDVDSPVHTKRRVQFLRFGLLSILLLTATVAIAIEKPMRKILGKRKIEQTYTKNIGPAEIDFIDGTYRPDSFPQWISKRFLPVDWKEVDTIRLDWLAHPNMTDQRSIERCDNQLKLIDVILQHPAATENVRTIHIAHELTPELQTYILSRRKLRVLEIRQPFSADFLHKLSRLKNLEVLNLWGKGITDKHYEALAELKWLKWIRVFAPRGESTGSLQDLREALPHTYIN